MEDLFLLGTEVCSENPKPPFFFKNKKLSMFVPGFVQISAQIKLNRIIVERSSRGHSVMSTINCQNP
jgi:hypothetical protein